MEMLMEMINDPDKQLAELKAELVAIGKELRSLMSKMGLRENVKLGKDGHEIDDLLEAVGRYEAARRALGIVNKLTPGPTKAKHVSRIMGNMNKLRALVNKLSAEFMDEWDRQTGNGSINENALIARKAADLIVRNKKFIPFCAKAVLRHMGFRANKKRTEELSKVEDGNLYKGCDVFTMKDADACYVNPKGWIMRSGERKFCHPLLHSIVRDYLNTNSALDFIPVEGGKILVDPRPSVMKSMGIKCETV